MTPPTELPTFTVLTPAARVPPRNSTWLADARRARWLSYVSLIWMLAEGIVGIVAGVEAHSVGVLAWAVGSAVEAAAAVIVIIRFSGANRFSETAERRAQRWVAGSFFVLVPYILYEAAAKLINGGQPQRDWLAVGLLASSIVLMPALGRAKHRLGQRLGSDATAGEGTQNLLCAAQGVIGLAGLLLASGGAGFLDPVAAVIIAAIATKEGVSLWQGDECGCHTMPGWTRTPAAATAATASDEAGSYSPASMPAASAIIGQVSSSSKFHGKSRAGSESRTWSAKCIDMPSGPSVTNSTYGHTPMMRTTVTALRVSSLSARRPWRLSECS